MNKQEFVLENFKNIQDIIKFIDQKASAVLIVDGFIITVFLEVFKKLEFINLLNGEGLSLVSVIAFISGLVTVGSLIVQLFYLIFKVLRPRKAKNYCNEKICLFYYEHITGIEKEEFIKKSNKLNEHQITQEILGQVYEVSKIASKKNKNFNISLWLLFISLVSLVIYIMCINLL